MTTEPLLPDFQDQPQPPRPRRRRDWRKIIGIISAAMTVLTTLTFFVVIALFNNQSFRQYLIRATHDRLSDALGAELQVKDFGLHLSGLNPSVDMNDVAISGAAPYNNPPLLRVDHLSATVRIDSFLQRKWHFSNVQLDHPVVQVLVDAQGRNNLPHSQQSQSDVFDLAIRHVVINDGHIIYNDHQSSLDADLQDVQVETKFDPNDIRYYGSLAYEDGRLRVGNYNPIMHGFSAKFDATRTQIRLDEASLKSGPSQVDFSATLDDYAHPRVQGQYQATIDAGDVRRILKDSTLPSGVIKVAGGLHYDGAAGRPVIEALTIDGTLATNALQVTQQSRRITINDLVSTFNLEHGDLKLHGLRARMLGGSVAGEATIHDVTGAGDSKMHAVLKDVGLVQLQALANTPMPSDVMLTGVVNAEVDAAWRQSFNNLTARADAGVRATIRPIRPGARETIPLNADIHARYDARSGQISFEKTNVRMPQTDVALNGTVSSRSALDVRVQSSDLSETEALVESIHPMAPLGLGGAGSFVGTVSGTAAAPEIAGHLQAAPFHVRGTEWRTVSADVDAGPARVSLKNGAIQPAVRGQLTFDVAAGLTDWALTDASPIDVNVAGSQLNATDLINLSGKQAPVTGTVSARVSLHGTRVKPEGQGSLNLTNGVVYDEPVNSAALTFQGAGDALRGAIDVRLPAGAARGAFTYLPKTETYDAQLHSTGFRVDQLHALKARNVQLTGAFDVDASGMGSIDNPKLDVRIRAPRLQIQNQVINGLTLEANVADQVANVRLDTQSQDIFLRGKGTVHLTGDYDVDAAFDSSPISLQPVVATYLPSQATNVTGQTELHATIRGPLSDSSRLLVRATIPVLSLNYRNTVQLAAASPIQVDYTNGVLELQPATIRGTGTDLQIQGRIPLSSPAPAAIRAIGSVDLQVAQLFNPDITSSGQLRFNIDGYGRATGSNVQGDIQIVNANFAAAGAPLGLQNGNGVLRLTNDALIIDQFRGNVGSGSLTAQGKLTYQPATQFNLAVATSRVRTSFPPGVRETLDANLTLTGSMQSAVVRGSVRLQDLSFTRDFDVAELIGQFSGDTPAPPQAFANNVNLDIVVQSSSDLNLTSSKLSVQGAANLQVKGTAGDPVLTGRVRLDGGDLIFRGNRYVLEPSTLEFINPVKTEPVLNLVVNSKVQAYDIHMRMRGSLDRLRTTYTSDPTLPQADIINLLVFGKTTESSEATPGNFGAESLIASTVSGEITSRVEKVAGISQLSVDPALGDNQRNPGARITIQQRVTGNLFVTFATDSTSTDRQVIKLEYQMSPRVSLSGVRDQNGGFAFDVRMKRTW